MKTITFSHNLLSEMVVSLIILFALIFFTFPSAINSIFGIVKTLEAFSLAQGAKQHIVEHYAYTGEIAINREHPAFKTQGRYVENVRITEGSIHIALSERVSSPQTTLSFRTAVLNEDAPYALFWICGNAEPKQAFQWQTKSNETSTPYLLTQCR